MGVRRSGSTNANKSESEPEHAEMKFVEITGAELFQLATEDELPGLRAAGVGDDSRVRINPQGDIEVRQHGNWSVIGGLLGDYQARIKTMTGHSWE